MLTLAAALAILCLPAAQEAAETPVAYVLELVEPETPLVVIQVEVAGDADGTSVFSLSEGWAGIVEAGRDLELVEARGERDVLASTRGGSFHWSVEHAPGERLTLTFELSPTRHRANAGPPGGLGVPGLRLEPSEVPSFDTGFDHEASLTKKVVTGVRPGGPAERAGLKDGLALAGWSVTYGDPTRELELILSEGTTSRTLRYMPHGPSVLGWRMVRE